MAAVITDYEKVRARHHLGVFCKRCGAIKSGLEFHKRLPGPNAYRQPCKACARSTRATYARAYRKTVVGRANTKKTIAKWHAKHPAYERDRSKRRYGTDPIYRKRVHAHAVAWGRAHPEYARLAAAKRRMLVAAGGTIPPIVEIRNKFAQIDGCYFCGRKDRPLTIDHDLPISRGGTNAIENLLPACKPCNSSKHTKTATEFVAHRRARWQP